VRTPVRIASRGSELALWQANWVRDGLMRAEPGLRVELNVIRTTGDRILDVPLAQIGDRGLFTKEIDTALLEGRAEIAVHSLKDVPTRMPEGLVLAAVSEREDPRDVLLCRAGAGCDSLASLPAGARVGTSSLRRRAQLRAIRPDLEVLDLRGNLNTRLRKLDGGEYEAILLAAAGVLRLGWRERITEWLSPEQILPAVGQGALAVVARGDDEGVLALLGRLHDPGTAACVTAERAFLRSLEGGCQIPIGALATLDGERVRLEGLVADLDGQTILRDVASGPAAAAAALGERLAGMLTGRGAREILARIRAGQPVPAPPAP
jgi:hydroxymethylbilane synthase